MGRRKLFDGNYYVKADINPILNSALMKIHETLGVAKADIVRIAVYDYIMKNYPEFLKK